ncbi:hypothetical protein SAMN04488137_4929 [Fictibacillus solisalsi]|uniref:Uncharacterized protein n=1 Tax=Fictibacillus solisalsi TaxID=459525 RepID=A0A1H0CGL3_9BACL|nr:hypothetical protein SAMN04488137_4929 [Fictibacillus solisalsi]
MKRSTETRIIMRSILLFNKKDALAASQGLFLFTGRKGILGV